MLLSERPTLLRGLEADMDGRKVPEYGHPQSSGGFFAHLAEAIAINKERKVLYARLSQGRSKRLSNILINLERISLGFALYIDRRARRFQERQIPIIRDDFASMEQIKPATAPPRFRNRAGALDWRCLRELVSAYKKALLPAIRSGDFTDVASASYNALLGIEYLEESSQSHFVMARHLVESIGLAALNALRYAQMSDGKTVNLSKTFLKIQSLGLDWTAIVDRRAQELHCQGIGIVVNDVPEIPFKQRFVSQFLPLDGGG